MQADVIVDETSYYFVKSAKDVVLSDFYASIGSGLTEDSGDLKDGAIVIRVDNIATDDSNTAGSDWFGSAVTRPDLVLESFINLIHNNKNADR